jgi:hypothetical protein
VARFIVIVVLLVLSTNLAHASFLHRAILSKDPFQITLVKIYLELNPTLAQPAREVARNEEAIVGTPFLTNDVFLSVIRTFDSETLRSTPALRLVSKRFLSMVTQTLRDRGVYIVRTPSDFIRFILQTGSAHFNQIRAFDFDFNAFSKDNLLFFSTFISEWENFLNAKAERFPNVESITLTGGQNLFVAHIMTRLLNVAMRGPDKFAKLRSIRAECNQENVLAECPTPFLSHLGNHAIEELNLRGYFISRGEDQLALLEAIEAGDLKHLKTLKISAFFLGDDLKQFAQTIVSKHLPLLRDFEFEASVL